jgi:uncharacterized protein YciI
MSLSRICILLLAAASGYAQSGTYYVVFLRPHPERKELSKEESDRIQQAHMANIGKMAKDGLLVAAGPFGDKVRTISGIFVFKVDSLESAQRIAGQDPTVIEHRNTVDAHAWAGPAGIGDEYFRLHKRDPKTPENMQTRPLFIYYHGPSWDAKATERDALLTAHSGYIDRLRDQGKLAAGGRIARPDEMLALVVFKPTPDEDARRLIEDDPAVKAGVLRVEQHSWWCADHVLPW